MQRDLQESLDLFFEHPHWFDYEELNRNLRDQGMDATLRIVEKLIDCMPLTKAIVDSRSYGHSVIFDISGVAGGHLEALNLIIDQFYPECEAMSEDELDLFVYENFTFLGGAQGTLLNLGNKENAYSREWRDLCRSPKEWYSHHERKTL